MSAVVTVLNIIFVLIILAAAGIILRRMILTRQIPMSLLLFMIMPVAQLFMLSSLSFNGWSVFWVIGLLLSLASNILILLYTIAQEKKTAAIEELRETRHMIELEKSHYEAVEQRREELEKIRGEFNGKLEAVAGFVRSGEDEEARESISALAEKINRTKENPYCAIPVINAVLTQKGNDCAAAGIDLSVDLNLPAALDVSPMHLCSIFSNILDNAVAACQKIQNAEKPVIRLSSKPDGDYLIIKAVNPSAPPKKSFSGQGYGLRILSELAKQYGGDFRSGYQDGMYTLILSLAAVNHREVEVC